MLKSTWIRQPAIKTITKQIYSTDYIHIYLNLPEWNESFSSNIAFHTDDRNHNSNHRTQSEMK